MAEGVKPSFSIRHPLFASPMPTFQCRRCSACCRQPGFVYLTPADTERLAACLRMDVYQLTESYCLLLDRRHLVLQKNPDESCLFLELGGCSVYEGRPSQCRDFPSNWKTKRSMDYCEGLRNL
jgi:hypothetical protein